MNTHPPATLLVQLIVIGIKQILIFLDLKCCMFCIYSENGTICSVYSVDVTIYSVYSADGTICSVYSLDVTIYSVFQIL